MVTDAPLFFLERLSPARVEAIIAEQLTMPVGASMIHRIVAVMHHCPTLHKMGQVVARHEKLDPELRHRLQRLETMEPTTPLSAIMPILEHEQLPGLAGEGIQLAAAPLAEASVAVVLPFTWNVCGHRRAEGVFKVLRPGVQDRLNEELDIWPKAGHLH